MEQLLTDAGLTSAQSAAYLLLLQEGPLTPPQVASKLSLTRSNAYKVLEQLAGHGLAIQHEKRNKFVFSAGDPSALQDVLAKERNKVLAQEKAVKRSIETLRGAYEQTVAPLDVKAYRGSARLQKLYEEQAELGQTVHFIKSRADIPTLGYDVMHRVRGLPGQYGSQRFGITPDSVEAPNNPELDVAGGLTRTWIDEDDYTAPVEWSVSGDEVTIFIFEKDGSAVKIRNRAIAESLRQLWNVADKNIRQRPDYPEFPRKAGRAA